MSERDQFEARAAEKLRLPVEVIQSARNGDRYLHAFDSMNVMQPLNGWWDWWQASREALKAEHEPVAFFTYKCYLLHAGDPKVAEYSDPTPLYMEPLKAEQVATAHRLVNKRSGQVHPWVYTEGKIDASEGDIFRVEVMPLYTSPPSQPHPIDTTSQQYETLAKGEKSDS